MSAPTILPDHLWPRTPTGTDRSPQINELATALAKAQALIKPAVKDSENPYFKSKYADLASVFEACREALTSNGLAIIQRTVGAGDTVGITTTLMHGSGQWIEGTITLTLEDPTPQSVGSALTYLRRYSLSSMVGVAPDDDDGNAAQQRGRGRADPHAANDNGSARRAGSPPAPDGSSPPSSSGRSTLTQWSMYDRAREALNVSEDEARERVSKIVGRKIAVISECSYGELERVILKMREAASASV